MTAEPVPPPQWLPHPRDLQAAIAAFVARVRDGQRPAVLVMKMAAEDGRLFLMIDAMMWLLYRQYRFDELPDAIVHLEADLLALAEMVREVDDTGGPT